MPINTDKKKIAQGLIDKDKYDLLEQIAKKNKRSVSNLVAMLIEDYLDSYMKKDSIDNDERTQ